MASRNENYTILVMSAAVLVMADVNKKKRRQRRTNLFKKRSGTGILMDLKSQEISGQYKNFTRMTRTDFENLLQRIGPHISKQDTYFRTPISAQRLAVTLRFLATGDSYTSLQYLFRIFKQSIGRVVPQVCAALIKELQGYIKLPKTPTAWKQVSKIFETRWNLPHCAGALDGKHVVLQAPVKSGTEFFNYKSNFSIVLFALVDGDYNFMFADVGCKGRISDGGFLRQANYISSLQKTD
ncbi:unnamed protein product [Acanthoscelides obtectus]|uniref:DDE Tnp4 domain-containing protein n=1 Tax=Acanthoscelides obtectus TaxID=200917 RepID=A0A9P0JZK9_ACAOB|nr:unnamed protein product [Acanthoscelides obtectus]CAK1648659.1 Protein ANTAGONIST OF LIKE HETEROCHROMATIN PROTEIN 1 [Acanthoscelides obtectus]